jgi:hydrogen peroxide-dependent heme synthase
MVLHVVATQSYLRRREITKITGCTIRQTRRAYPGMKPHRSASPVPPATLEGWYVSHEALHLPWAKLREIGASGGDRLAAEARALMEGWAQPEGAGWSAAFQLVGGGGDLMLVHFRESLEALGEAALRWKRSELGTLARSEYHFLSITEAGLYHATAQAAAAHEPGSKEFSTAIEEAAAEEAASPHVKTRLYPEVPDEMRYLSFYPMTKRRVAGDNWYTLPIEERNRLMREHGLTGRRYGGRVFQVISGSVGFADWEWGVTLFARDPLEFKRIVTEMRYDEASARYGEFGRFFTGMRMEPADWARLLTPG